MEVIYNQFIGTYKKAVPKNWCEEIINVYENSPDKYTRQELENISSLLKKDTHSSIDSFSEELKKPFIDFLTSTVLPHYDKQYSFSDDGLNLIVDDFKVQKTNPTEGYHMWHCENLAYEYTNRILVYTLYLNDVKEGGETEFLYQSLRINPEQGTIIIFPAGFTHTHRGNPPLSGPKYIITGWITAIPPQQ